MISVLTPTRGRPASVRRLIDSGRTLAADPVEFVFRCDENDPELSRIADQVENDDHCIMLTGPQGVLSEMWNECYAVSSGSIVMQCGDDIIFRTPMWDKLVEQAFFGYPDGIALVYGNDCLQGANLATHGFVTRRWVNTVGHFTPSQFSSDYGDQWLFDVARGIGRTHYVPELVTEHMHPVAGKAEWDRTHQERLERHRRDNVAALYESLAAERQADIDALRKVMAQ